MSHFVKVSMKITDKNMVEKALKSLGITYSGAGTIMNNAHVDIKIDNALGLVQRSDGTFELQGDPYYSKSLKKYYGKERDLSNRIALAYTIEKTKTDLERLGFAITENAEAVVGEDGTIQMVASSWNY